MKNLATAYTYNPVAKTLTLTGLNVPLSYLLLVVNATRGAIIYNLADPALAAANFVQGANSVLTLNASVDTSFHDASDALTIFYDDGVQTNTLLIQGPAGPQGPKGDPGNDGADGLNGADGADGINGTNGVDGIDGTDGADGREVELQKSATHLQWRYLGDPAWTDLVPLADLKGDKGDKGDAGTDGQDGNDGQPGTDGTNGTDGTDGASAYEVAVANGYTGTEGDWLLTLKGEKGDKGDKGDPGSTEISGITGLQAALDGKAAAGLTEGGEVQKANELRDLADNETALKLYDTTVTFHGVDYDEGSEAASFRAAISAASTSHKSTHATGGSDALTPADIGAQTQLAFQDLVTPNNTTIISLQTNTFNSFLKSQAPDFQLQLPQTATNGDRVVVSRNAGTGDGLMTIQRFLGGVGWQNLVSLTAVGQLAAFSFFNGWRRELPFHTHAIADTTGLQTALDAKASTSALAALEARVAALEAAQSP